MSAIHGVENGQQVPAETLSSGFQSYHFFFISQIILKLD